MKRYCLRKIEKFVCLRGNAQTWKPSLQSLMTLFVAFIKVNKTTTKKCLAKAKAAIIAIVGDISMKTHINTAPARSKRT